MRFCVTVPEGFELALSIGSEFSREDFEMTNINPSYIDAIIITANGDKSTVVDAMLYLDAKKKIKWKTDESEKGTNDLKGITISEIVNYPIVNETDPEFVLRPSRQFSFYRPFYHNDEIGKDISIHCYEYNKEADDGETNGIYVINARHRADASKNIIND